MTVSTPEACIAYVNEVGLCAWRNGTPLPSLEAVSPWAESGDIMMQTWFWKDDLHIEKQLHYGPLWGAGVPVFASLALLPALIAAQGDCDPRDLYEKGHLSRVALTLYEHVERHGPTAKNRLPYPTKTSQTPPLVQLQQRFLLTKVGLTGRTRGTYGYLWGRSDTFYPDAFAAAARLSVTAARHTVVERLGLPEALVAKALRWRAE